MFLSHIGTGWRQHNTPTGKLLAMALSAMLLAVMVTQAHAAGEFTPPKDGTFTEKQLTNFLQAQKEILQQVKNTGKSVEKNANAMSALAAIQLMDAQNKAILSRHGLSDAEYQWINSKLMEAYGASMMADQSKVMLDGFTKQIADTQKAIDDAKAKQAIYQAALKGGTRVMSDQDRENAIKSAKDDTNAANDEAKQHADEVKSITEEINKDLADAKAARDLAKTPPSDVGADDRADYIKGKLAEGDTATQAAKDAGDRLKDAKTAYDAAMAKVAAAQQRGLHPDIPTTDDDKAQVKSDNEAGLKNATATIQDNTVNLVQMNTTYAEMGKTFADQLGKVPKQNVELFKAHQKEFMDSLGALEDKK